MKKLVPTIVLSIIIIMITVILILSQSKSKIQVTNTQTTSQIKDSSFLNSNVYPLPNIDNTYSIICVVDEVNHSVDKDLANGVSIRSYFVCKFLNANNSISSLNVINGLNIDDQTFIPGSKPFTPIINDTLIEKFNTNNEIIKGRTVVVSFFDPTFTEFSNQTITKELTTILPTDKFEQLKNGQFSNNISTFVYPYYVSTDHNGEKYVEF